MAGSKPIEAGCMVLITGARRDDSPNVGKMGIAVRVVKKGDLLNMIPVGTFGDGCWLIEAEGLCCSTLRRGGGNDWVKEDMCLARAHHLLRIDPEADPLDVTHEEPIGALHGS